MTQPLQQVSAPGRFAGRVVLITGVARGQGAAEASAFAREGAVVVGCDVRDELGSRALAALGPAHHYQHLDVRDPEQWHRVIDSVVAELGPPAVVVNNAGIMRAGELIDQDPADVRAVLDVNLLGTLYGMQIAGRAMRDGGAIVNVSSTSGIRARPRQVAYSASKWGVRGATKAAAVELAPFGIRVNSVHPGTIDTPMLSDHGIDAARASERHGARLLVPRPGTADEVADLVLFLCSDDAAYITGAEFVIDGGLTVG